MKAISVTNTACFTTAKHLTKNMIYAVLAMLFLYANLYAQDDDQSVNTVLTSLPTEPAQEFAQPLVNAIGATLNTGWMTKAPDADISGLNVRFGLVGSSAFINGQEDVFKLIGIIFRFQEDEARELARGNIFMFDELDPDLQKAIIEEIAQTQFKVNIDGPTIFGSENDNLVVSTAEEQSIRVGSFTYTIAANDSLTFDDVTGLWDRGFFPTVVPQLSLGTVYGTQATFRYLPSIGLGDVGDLKYFGYGIQHNPGVWFQNPLPVDIGLSFFTQKVKIDTVLEINTTAFGAQVSKTFGSGIISFTPYAGFLIESSDMSVDYTYALPGINADVEIEFDLEGQNKNRFIIGSGINLLGLNIFADYNISQVNSANVSIMYSF